MKSFYRTGFVMLLTTLAVVMGAQQGFASEKPLAEDGTIDLIRGIGIVDCTFKFETGQWRLSHNNDGCSNDVNKAFRLNNVPSATTFILADSGACLQDENFWYEFKTIKYETTTDVIWLASIVSLEDGAVVTPGLRLIKKIIKPGDPEIEGKLSCLKIIRSE